MNSRVSAKRFQQGAFAIEMTIVLMGLAALLMFGADLSQQVLSRAKLDRMSYSLVTLVKERQRFYQGREALSQADFNQVDQIAARLLGKQSNEQRGQFGITVQSLIEGRQTSYTRSLGDNTPCQPKHNLTALTELVPTNDEGTGVPLYQVTVCVTSESWFDRTLGDHLISSTSVMPGR